MSRETALMVALYVGALAVGYTIGSLHRWLIERQFRETLVEDCTNKILSERGVRNRMIEDATRKLTEDFLRDPPIRVAVELQHETEGSKGTMLVTDYIEHTHSLSQLFFVLCVWLNDEAMNGAVLPRKARVRRVRFTNQMGT